MVQIVPRASAGETAAVVADVLLPLVARGPIARRPRVVGLLDANHPLPATFSSYRPASARD